MLYPAELQAHRVVVPETLLPVRRSKEIAGAPERIRTSDP
jgi:hypothetical protein